MVISAQVVSAWQSTCYAIVGPTRTQQWLVVPKKQKAAAGGEENIILLQCRSTLQNGKKEESCLQVPF